MSHALLQAWEKTLRLRGGDRAVVQAADGVPVPFRELDERASAWLGAHAPAQLTRMHHMLRQPTHPALSGTPLARGDFGCVGLNSPLSRGVARSAGVCRFGMVVGNI